MRNRPGSAWRQHHHRHRRGQPAPADCPQLGADVTLNFNEVDVVDEILKLTGGRGVDAAIEALKEDTDEARLPLIEKALALEKDTRLQAQLEAIRARILLAEKGVEMRGCSRSLALLGPIPGAVISPAMEAVLTMNPS